MASIDGKVARAGDRWCHRRWSGAIAPVDGSREDSQSRVGASGYLSAERIRHSCEGGDVLCRHTWSHDDYRRAVASRARTAGETSARDRVGHRHCQCENASTSIGVGAIDGKGGAGGCRRHRRWGGAIAPVDGSREGSLP